MYIHFSPLTLLVAGASASALISRGYSVPGYNSTYTGDVTINAPDSCTSQCGVVYHPPGAYDPNLCATDCNNQRAKQDPLHGKHCRFFTSYQLLKNGVLESQVCALYSRTWDTNYANYSGYTANGDQYTVANAASFTYTAQPGNRKCPQGGPHKKSPVPNGPLTSCPAGHGSYIVPYDRSLYEICVDTAFEHKSTQVVNNVADNRACGDSCDSVADCTTANYNPGTETCYLKGNLSIANSNWRGKTGFQTLQLVPEGISFSACLAPLYGIYQNGVEYLVCPASVFAFSSPNIWYQVASEYACASLCQSVSDCNKFWYNWGTQTCYDAGNAPLSSSQWLTQYDVNTYWLASGPSPVQSD